MMRKQSKMYAAGGKTKTKTHPDGYKYEKGGKTKLKMVEKDGEMVPFFAADGEGNMMKGGKVPGTKGYFKGGKVL